MSLTGDITSLIGRQSFSTHRMSMIEADAERLLSEVEHDKQAELVAEPQSQSQSQEQSQPSQLQAPVYMSDVKAVASSSAAEGRTFQGFLGLCRLNGDDDADSSR